MSLTREEVEAIAERAAQKAALDEAELQRLIAKTVEQTLTQLGVEHDDPLEMQRDFQYLREFRTTSATLKERGLLALIAIMLSGFVALLVMGVKESIRP